VRLRYRAIRERGSKRGGLVEKRHRRKAQGLQQGIQKGGWRRERWAHGGRTLAAKCKCPAFVTSPV